jgi:hypothetical protein
MGLFSKPFAQQNGASLGSALLASEQFYNYLSFGGQGFFHSCVAADLNFSVKGTA